MKPNKWKCTNNR